MIPQNDARIFPAGSRTITYCEGVKSFTSLGVNNRDVNLPAESALQLKDIVLNAGKTVIIAADESADLIVLPIAGTLDFRFKGTEFYSEPGNVHCISLEKGETVEFSNPYKEEAVNFLQLWIKKRYIKANGEKLFSSFEVETNKNSLINLFGNTANDDAIKFYIGSFNGRSEALHQLSKPGNAVFVFIIHGAFEVQYRLLEARDGLMLWNLDEVDLEALSENAVILLAEFPVKKN